MARAVAELEPQLRERLEALAEDAETAAQVGSALLATLNSFASAWNSTADAKKRRLIMAALVNAFDRETYEEGLAVRPCFAASLSSLFEGSAYETKIREALDYVLDASPRPERFADFPRKFFFVRRGGEPGLRANRQMLERIVRGS